MSNSLYALSDEYLQAAKVLSDLDMDEQTVADTLEGLAGALEVKATNVAMFAKNLEATAEAIKQAEADMAARRKAIENRAARVRAYLKSNMERTGLTEISCPHFKIAIRKNPPSVSIVAEELIPAEFKKQLPPPPPTVDKKAIADALKAGQDVPGARLEQGTRVDIK